MLRLTEFCYGSFDATLRSTTAYAYHNTSHAMVYDARGDDVVVVCAKAKEVEVMSVGHRLFHYTRFVHL